MRDRLLPLAALLTPNLDEAITRLTLAPPDDQLLLRRLKKRKLLIKDRISQLERMLDPDPDEYA
mgnify:CR=1 FL=1